MAWRGWSKHFCILLLGILYTSTILEGAYSRTRSIAKQFSMLLQQSINCVEDRKRIVDSRLETCTTICSSDIDTICKILDVQERSKKLI
jgi:hypothetical protein